MPESANGESITRRRFFTSMTATACGVLVPEWILDPLKGRSMVAVPNTPKSISDELFKDHESFMATFYSSEVITALERKYAAVYFKIAYEKIRDALLFEKEHLRSFGVLGSHA